ncbi:MAG: ATP synthase F1 subunit epsilon [Planctomycetota bacterium]|nr:MAG: ATP synthase F1 subunit epsilon [Planctomycetota bacterium]
MADHAAPTTSGTLTCVVVTPEQTVLSESTDFVALPLFDGELGVAPKHSPMIGRLGYGELRLGRGSHAKRYYIDGGFVQVLNDVVTVLTGRAIEVSHLDAAVAREQLRTAQGRKANTDELLAIRDRIITQSRAQIRLAERGTATARH